MCVARAMCQKGTNHGDPSLLKTVLKPEETKTGIAICAKLKLDRDSLIAAKRTIHPASKEKDREILRNQSNQPEKNFALYTPENRTAVQQQLQ